MVFLKLRLEAKAVKGLIGAFIIKFSTSITSCWGNTNLYFLSYFHHEGTEISPQTNAITLLLSVIPMVLALIFAIKLCTKYGYLRVIRTVSFIFFLSPLVSILSFNLYTFVIFSVVIPGCMFAMSAIPVLNCVWTLLPDHKNKVTALMVVAFGLGGTVWNLIFMHMINPNNHDASDQEGNIHFFPPEVTANVRQTAIIGFAITGAMNVLGSWLLQRNEVKEQLEPPKSSIETHSVPDDISGESSEKVIVNSESTAHKITLKTALKDERFIIIMAVSFLTGLYQIHLLMNFKIIYMPIISDDHFLSYASMLCSLVSIGAAFIWGFLGDLKGVAFTILVLSVLDIGSKAFGDFAETKPTIIVMVALIGLISKSMTTIAGPGFVELFGLKVGTEMLPYKGISILLGYVIVPLFQIITSSHLDPHQYLILISFTSILTFVLSLRLFLLGRKRQRYTLNQEKLEDKVEPKIQNQLQNVPEKKIQIVNQV